jgi:hypothetical protein
MNMANPDGNVNDIFVSMRPGFVVLWFEHPRTTSGTAGSGGKKRQEQDNRSHHELSNLKIAFYFYLLIS